MCCCMFGVWGAGPSTTVNQCQPRGGKKDGVDKTNFIMIGCGRTPAKVSVRPRHYDFCWGKTNSKTSGSNLFAPQNFALPPQDAAVATPHGGRPYAVVQSVPRQCVWIKVHQPTHRPIIKPIPRTAPTIIHAAIRVPASTSITSFLLITASYLLRRIHGIPICTSPHGTPHACTGGRATDRKTSYGLFRLPLALFTTLSICCS